MDKCDKLCKKRSRALDQVCTLLPVQTPLTPHSHSKQVFVQMPTEVAAMVANSESMDTYDEPCKKRLRALDQVCTLLSEGTLLIPTLKIGSCVGAY